MNTKQTLKKLLSSRIKLIETINDCNSKKAIIEQKIFNLYDNLEIDSVEHGDKIYRKQVNKYVNWNIDGLRKYLNKKFRKSVVNSMITPVVTTKYVIDEEEVHKNITQGKLKLSNLKKYIDFKESKPFIRIYDMDKKK